MALLFRRKKQQTTLKKIYSYRELISRIQDMLHDYTEMFVENLGQEEELRRSQEEYRRMISNSIRTCCSGNSGARETVKELILFFLNGELIPNREALLRVVPFETPCQMTAWQQLEAMIFYFEKKADNQGFEQMCRYFNWNRNGSVVSIKEIENAYLELSPKFTPEEERKILAQLLFAGTVGLGIVDTLNYQKGYIEEIQIGMGGRSALQYNYKELLSGKNADSDYSRDGIHVMAGGNTIWMKALSFETEEELQRVLRNLVKESQGGELTRNHPMMVVDTVDGRRISVSRPPMSDAWIGLIRKFDTIQTVSLEKLYQGYPEEQLLPGLLRQLIRSGRNIAITGEMASGKTTLFRACLTEVKKDRNIRVIETDSFELNIRGFLPKANSMTMRVTEHTTIEEVLAFVRKTTGQIFAIGEINSAAAAVMAMDLSKIASQMFFSAHYVTTEHMIADFVNAKLCVGGYSEEILAELDVVRSLGFDIHLSTKHGKRYVQYINEVVPVSQAGTIRGTAYEIRQIYRYDEEKGQGELLNVPGEITYEKAKQLLEEEEYLEFSGFFKG